MGVNSHTHAGECSLCKRRRRFALLTFGSLLTCWSPGFPTLERLLALMPAGNGKGLDVTIRNGGMDNLFPESLSAGRIGSLAALRWNGARYYPVRAAEQAEFTKHLRGRLIKTSSSGLR